MSENIVLSYIIPAHNAEKTLEKAVTSIINGMEEQVEILIINDSSTDRTDLCAKKIIRKNSSTRFKYFEVEFGSAGSSRQLGIEAAIGQYVIFCDCDDYINSNSQKVIMQYLINNHPDVLWMNHYRRSQKRLKKCETRVRNKKDVAYSLKTGFLPVRNVNSFKVLWNKAYSRSFIIDNKVAMSSMRTGEDALFNLEAFKYNPKVDLLNVYAYYYNVNVVASLTHTGDVDLEFDTEMQIVDMIKTMTSNNLAIDSILCQEQILLSFTFSKYAEIDMKHQRELMRLALKSHTKIPAYFAKKWISVYRLRKQIT